MDTTHTGHLTLVQACLGFENAFAAFVADFRQAGECCDQLLSGLLDDYTEYVRRAQELTHGVAMAHGLVPQTTYWMVRNRTDILGIAHLRRYLTESLEREGGHIGYSIRPSERRKGYGKRFCALLLDEARRELPTDTVLITCNTGNRPSARIIEANGGVFIDEVISVHTGLPVSRYRVAL